MCSSVKVSTQVKHTAQQDSIIGHLEKLQFISSSPDEPSRCSESKSDNSPASQTSTAHASSNSDSCAHTSPSMSSSKYSAESHDSLGSTSSTQATTHSSRRHLSDTDLAESLSSSGMNSSRKSQLVPEVSEPRSSLKASNVSPGGCSSFSSEKDSKRRCVLEMGAGRAELSYMIHKASTEPVGMSNTVLTDLCRHLGHSRSCAYVTSVISHFDPRLYLVGVLHVMIHKSSAGPVGVSETMM